MYIFTRAMGAELVKREFETFLKTHSPLASIDNVDDIVLSYIADVLCGLGEDEGSFDIGQFSEMISAYVPEFSTVPSGVVCEWVFDLVDKQRSINERRHKLKEPSGTTSTKTELPCCETSGHKEIIIKGGNTVKIEGERRSEECSNIPKQTVSEPTSGDNENIALLQEMFPDLARSDLVAALRTSGGNMDQVIQRLLRAAEHQRRSNVKSEDTLRGAVRHLKMDLCDDKDLKETVLTRYAYVDVGEDEATHHPVLSKAVPKKMVRYRDNQVVNTKGERYTVLTRKDTESEEMKKTYINLNPLRKYRFH